jgi:uncharacterized lipoprotein YajG
MAPPSSTNSKEPTLKIVLAFVAVLLLAACAATGQPSDSPAAPVKAEGGNVQDSFGGAVNNSKY